ncbi:MAG: hypothetical protein H6Q89_593 [Myxococcaceae bacterium]|nr:hypothetical protein [Myxococcaceae bacterium]
MSRLRLLGVALALSACGSTSGAGFKVAIEYHLQAAADACIRLRASPERPMGQTRENSLSLQGRAPDGTISFGVLLADDWSGSVTLTATLHRPCGSTPVLARDARQEPAPAQGKVVQLALRLDEAPLGDGGTDGGAGDGGAPADAGPDAGADGGVDAGTDGGAGLDAGPVSCDGGLGLTVGPPMLGGTWRDVAPYPGGGVWLAGGGALFYRAAGGAWVSAGPTCSGEHHAAWARPDGRVYFGTNDAGLRYTDPTAGSVCQLLPTPAGTGPTGDVYAMAGFVDAGTVVIYSATLSGNVLRNTDPPLPALDRRWDLADAGVRQLWAIAGYDESSLFAAGLGNSGNDGIILKYDPAADLWVREIVTLPETVNDLSVVSPTLAFAGTEGNDLYVWNGTVWSVLNKMFGKPIYGVQAFSATSVYAVGLGAVAKRWNGTDWINLGPFGGGADFLARIRGLNACELWSGGTTGTVITSQ